MIINIINEKKKKTRQRLAVAAVLIVVLAAFGGFVLKPILTAPSNASELALTTEAAQLTTAANAQVKAPVPGVSYDAMSLRELSHLVMRRDLYYPHINAVRLYIDGKPHVAVDSYQTAKSILDALNNYDTAPGNQLLDVNLEQRITFKSENIGVAQFDGFSDFDGTMTYIKNGGIEVLTYTIVKGDTLSEIAYDNDTTVDDIIADNPYLKTKKYLTIGDQLVINRPESLVTQFATVVESHVEQIEPSRKYLNDDSLYVGEEHLVSKGEPGELFLIEKIVYRNGRDIARTLESEEVLSEAVDDVYRRGTKPLPPQLAKSTLMRPLTAYRVTSRFGPRRLGYHYGIDLKVSTGTPVYAAEAGVVTTSGYRGARGRLIVIDHGNGLETYYEHNSKLLVEVGERVSKGQKICLSGNTGRSTGPHLHFEIQLNGVPVNPEKYLPF